VAGLRGKVAGRHDRFRCCSASTTATGCATWGTWARAFTDAMLADLAEQLRPLGRETSPFGTKIPSPAARDARWVEPSLVGYPTPPLKIPSHLRGRECEN